MTTPTDPNFTDEVRITDTAHDGRLTRGFLRSAENRDTLWINAATPVQSWGTLFGKLFDILGSMLDGDWETVAMLREAYYGAGDTDTYVDPAERLAASGQFANAVSPGEVETAVNSSEFVQTQDAPAEYAPVLDRIAASHNPSGSYSSHGADSTIEGLTDMTIAEVLEVLEQNPDTGIGRYGFKAELLEHLVEQMPNITTDSKFSTSVQDQLGTKVLEDVGIVNVMRGEATLSDIAAKIDENFGSFITGDAEHDRASIEAVRTLEGVTPG